MLSRLRAGVAWRRIMAASFREAGKGGRPLTAGAVGGRPAGGEQRKQASGVHAARPAEEALAVAGGARQVGTPHTSPRGASPDLTLRPEEPGSEFVRQASPRPASGGGAQR